MSKLKLQQDLPLKEQLALLMDECDAVFDTEDALTEENINTQIYFFLDYEKTMAAIKKILDAEKADSDKLLDLEEFLKRRWEDITLHHPNLCYPQTAYSDLTLLCLEIAKRIHALKKDANKIAYQYLMPTIVAAENLVTMENLAELNLSQMVLSDNFKYAYPLTMLIDNHSATSDFDRSRALWDPYIAIDEIPDDKDTKEFEISKATFMRMINHAAQTKKYNLAYNTWVNTKNLSNNPGMALEFLAKGLRQGGEAEEGEANNAGPSAMLAIQTFQAYLDTLEESTKNHLFLLKSDNETSFAAIWDILSGKDRIGFSCVEVNANKIESIYSNKAHSWIYETETYSEHLESSQLSLAEANLTDRKARLEKKYKANTLTIHPPYPIDYNNLSLTDNCNFRYVLRLLQLILTREKPFMEHPLIADFIEEQGNQLLNASIKNALLRNDTQSLELLKQALYFGLSPITASCFIANTSLGHKPRLKEVCQLLMNAGTDLNTKVEGKTPLQLAAKNGHLEFVKLLLKYNANPYAAGDNKLIPLAYAAKKGHFDVVVILSQKMQLINLTEDEMYAIYLAIRQAVCYNYHEIVYLLLTTFRIDINRVFESSNLLTYAIEEASRDSAMVLLERGADPNALMHKNGGSEALYLAINNECFDIAEMLLAANADALIELPDDSPIRLTDIVNYGYVKLTDLLLKAGFSPEEESNGETALYLALKGGYYDIAQLLINADATPGQDKKGTMRLLPLLLNRIQGDNDFIFTEFLDRFSKELFTISLESALFDENIISFNVLKRALYHGLDSSEAFLFINNQKTASIPDRRLAAICQLLLEAGAPLSTKSKGKTALQLAAETGHTKLLKIFLTTTKVDVNWIYEGETLLTNAINAGAKESISLLLEHGASANAVLNTDGSSKALSIAIAKRNFKVAEKLLEASATVGNSLFKNSSIELKHIVIFGYKNLTSAFLNNTTMNGFALDSALSTAIKKEYLQLLPILINAGADVNRPDERGETPLILAIKAKYDSLELTTTLINAKANPNRRNYNCNELPINLAISNNNTAVVKLLIQAGADIKKQWGCSYPLSHAMDLDNTKIIKYLLRAGADANEAYFLRTAVERKNLKHMQLLLPHTNPEGIAAALQAAVTKGFDDRVLTILKFKPYAALLTYLGNTTLELAAENNDLAILPKLLYFDPALLIRDAHCIKVLSVVMGIICRKKIINSHCIQLIKLLLDLGADVNQPVHHEHSAMQLAMRNAHHGVIKLFYEVGIVAPIPPNPTCRDSSAKSREPATTPDPADKPRMTKAQSFGLKWELRNLLLLQQEYTDIQNQPSEWQTFFGLSKTAEWQDAVHDLRQKALAQIEYALEQLDCPKDQRHLIEMALKLPLFYVHRSNYFFSGNFGNTASVSQLKKWQAEIIMSENAISSLRSTL